MRQACVMRRVFAERWETNQEDSGLDYDGVSVGNRIQTFRENVRSFDRL